MIVNDILVKHQDGRTQSLLSPPLCVTSLEGLGVEVQQTTTKLFGIDGSLVNTETIPDRTITMRIQNFDKVHTTHNEWVNDLFPPKQSFELILRGTKGAEKIQRKVSCRLKRLKPADYTEDDSYDLMLTCNDPYFYDEFPIAVQNYPSKGMFHFPFSVREVDKPIVFGRARTSQRDIIYNQGSIPIGLKMYMYILESGTATSGIKFYTLQHPEEFIKLNITLSPRETLLVDTNDLTAGVFTTSASGVTRSRLADLSIDSTFFKLNRGRNDLIFEVEGGQVEHIEVTYVYNNPYAGV